MTKIDNFLVKAWSGVLVGRLAGFLGGLIGWSGLDGLAVVGWPGLAELAGCPTWLGGACWAGCLAGLAGQLGWLAVKKDRSKCRA